MKSWIKTSIAAAVIATGALGTTAALAWGGHCDGPRGGKSGWSQMAPEQMKAKMAERRAAEAPKTAIERMQRMEEMSKLRQAEMGEARKSVETFYATLSDAQKTVFDAEFQKMGRKGERGMKGGGPRDGSGMGPGRG